MIHNEEVLLYHYSTKKFDKILSLSGQGKVNNEWSPDYSDHISLFLAPIPRDLPAILHNEHNFFKDGAEIYEYVIPLSALPKDIKYVIVETPEKIDLIYNKQNWDIVDTNPEIREKYMKEITDLETKLKYRGNKTKDFLEGYERLDKDIRKSYIEAYKIHKARPEDELMEKYAANVPHVMFYIGTKPVKPISVEKIKLTNKMSKDNITLQSLKTNRDVKGLIRDKNFMDSLISIKGDKVYCSKRCSIEFPSWYFDKNMGGMGRDISYIGIASIIVDNKYCITTIPTIVRSNPIDMSQVERGGQQYTRLEFGPGDPIFSNTHVVKETLMSYDFFNHFFLRTKVPWFIEYDDMVKLMNNLMYYAGSGVGKSPIGNELAVSFITRDAKNPENFFRQTGMTGEYVFIDLMDVYLSVRNVIDRLTGGYFKDALVGSLLDDPQDPTNLEIHLK